MTSLPRIQRASLPSSSGILEDSSFEARYYIQHRAVQCSIPAISRDQLLRLSSWASSLLQSHGFSTVACVSLSCQSFSRSSKDDIGLELKSLNCSPLFVADQIVADQISPSPSCRVPVRYSQSPLEMYVRNWQGSSRADLYMSWLQSSCY